MDTPNIIPNGPDPDLAYAAIHEIEKIEAELESEKGAYMARCRAIKERRKAAIEEYRDRGLSKRDIVDALKVRKLEAKIENLIAERNEESKEEALQLDLFLAAVKRGEDAYHGVAA
jgi:predicted RNase H-like nuclease